MLNVKVVSLGCAKNLVDSEVIAGLLQEAGYSVSASASENAEIVIVNTCGFIAAAKEESIDAILEIARSKQEGRCRVLVVTGCLAQRYKEDLLSEIPEIDGLIGTGEIPRIVEVVTGALEGTKAAFVDTPSFIYNHEIPRLQSTPGYSAYIKVAEGCNNRCSYCAIPLIRGVYRSRPVGSILKEAELMALRGVKEVNLIAQDTTRYGLDLYGEYRLSQLVSEMAGIEGISWVRLLYAYPTHFTDELIDVVAATDKICKYLDIPLQHADNRLLKAMNRQGSSDDILNLITKLRTRIPDLTLRTSFIVGFPGETESEFNNLVEFVKNVGFDRMGVFTYSPEEDTMAAEMPGQVAEEVKEERRDLLMRIQQDISLRKNKAKVGKIISVLIEGKEEAEQEVYVGRTEADAPEVDGTITVRGQGLLPGDIVKVRVTHAYEYDLIGEVIK